MTQDLPTANLASRLRRARSDAGMSQQVLATRAGIGLRTLLRIEQGEDARLSTLQAIADALHVPVESLIAEPAA